MHGPYVLFAFILPAVFIARGLLYFWPAQAGLFFLISLLVCTVIGLDFHRADGSIASIVNCAGGIICSILAVMGIVAPAKFFAAFRILGGVLFVRLLIGAMSTNELEQGEEWSVAVFVGFPCLLFAWKARLPSSGEIQSDDTIHVLLNEANVPSFEQWQDFLDSAGYGLSIQANSSLRDHSGDLRVVFQGTTLGLRFKVAPLSEILAEARLPASIASRFGDGTMSAYFAYDSEFERLAALVAAAALTELSDGSLVDVAKKNWSDADDAIDEALDIVQPYELHVLAHDENIPTSQQWQSSLNESAMAVASWEPFDIREYMGFLQLTVQGMTTGLSTTRERWVSRAARKRSLPRGKNTASASIRESPGSRIACQ